MPLYEYQCRKCGEVYERIRKFSDPPLRKCAKCGGKLERLLSAPAVHFKGSGWYVTDYARKSSSTSTSKPEGSSDGQGKKASDAASDAKKDGAVSTTKASKDSEPASEK